MSPPCLVCLVPPDDACHCNVTNHGQWQRHKGVWGVVKHVVEEEEGCTVVLICQVLTRPGVDNGGKRSSVTLV